MSWLDVILLAVVQGLTEFLPVSSSGHLRVAGALFGWQEPQTLLDVCLHGGTLVAVLAFFRRDVLEILHGLADSAGHVLHGRFREGLTGVAGTRMAFFVVLGTLPAGAVGVGFGEDMETLAADLGFLAWMFMANGVLLLASRTLVLPGGRGRMNRGAHGMRWTDALFVGCAQALGVFRGISRSGATIAAGLVAGMDRETAARYSFLLSVPAVLGALVLHLREGIPPGGPPAAMLLVGAATAAVTGLAALGLILRAVRAGWFHLFGFYTLVLGLVLLAWDRGWITWEA
ncbi:MAG: undecaprenyl-diphosphate phosphatase [Deltaproteobacteria bacterium]|nr:undecaprenyl-diphosphate phosphatase [Deltaproteobacteria bacterium]